MNGHTSRLNRDACTFTTLSRHSTSLVAKTLRQTRQYLISFRNALKWRPLRDSQSTNLKTRKQYLSLQFDSAICQENAEIRSLNQMQLNAKTRKRREMLVAKTLRLQCLIQHRGYASSCLGLKTAYHRKQFMQGGHP